MTKQRILGWMIFVAGLLTVGYFGLTLYYIRGQASTVAPLSSTSNTTDSSSSTTGSGATNTDTSSGSTTTEPAPTSTGDTAPAPANNATATPPAPTTGNATPPASATTSASSTSTQNTTAPSTATSEPSNTTTAPTITTTAPETTAPTSTPTTTKTAKNAGTPTSTTAKSATPQTDTSPIESKIRHTMTLHRNPTNEKGEIKDLAIHFQIPYPNTDVQLVIKSDPITVNTKSDAEGNVAYDLKAPLAVGQHTLTVNVIDPASQHLVTVERAFDIKKAEAVGILDQATNTSSFALVFDIRYLLLLVAAMILAILIVYSVYRQNIKSAEQITTHSS